MGAFALADDMTRLRGEVDALRSARGDFIQNLKSSVASMLTEFSAGKADRIEFVKELKSSVASMLAEVSADLAGAHRAWFGPTAEKTFPTAEKTFQKTKSASKGKKGKG